MYKQLASVVAISAALLAAVPASATTIVYTATLAGAAEATPNGSTAFGLGLVTFDDVALTMMVNELYIGLTGGSVTGAHIHCCTTTPGTGTASVVQDFTAFGFPTTTSGNYDHTFTLSAATFTLLSNGAASGRAYLNIHTPTYPGGEIRGFLMASPVPEPASMALMLGGLAVVGAAARRRRSN